MKLCSIVFLLYLPVPEARLRKYPKLDKTAVLTTLNVSLNRNLCLSTDADGYPELMEKSDVIVDKSLFIEEIIYSNEMVHVINCPPKWGKSTNLNMLKTFLEIQVDERGNLSVAHEESSNYKLFKNGQIETKNGTKVFQFPPRISKRRKLFNQYQGKYPVIYLDFGGLNAAPNYDSFMLQMKGAIAKTFKQHIYLKWQIKNEISHPANRRLYNATSELQTADHSFDMFLWEWDFVDAQMLSSSLLFLSKLLHRFFGQKPVILLDGYDTPLNILLTYGDFKEKTKLTDFMIRLFQSTVLENAHFTKAVVSGVLSVSGKDLFSNSSQVAYHNFLDGGQIFEFFGFNEGEIGSIFDKLGVSAESHSHVCDYYLGYRSGEYYDLNVTNMLSISNFLKTGELDNYWFPETKFVEDQLLKLLNDFNFRTKLIRLIFHDTIDLNILSDRNFRINDYYDLSQLTRKFFPLTFEFKNPLKKGLKMLANIGYLTSIPSDTNSSESQIRYKIANEEIRTSLLDLLKEYFMIMLDLNNKYKEVIYRDFVREFEYYLICTNPLYATTTLPEEFKKALEHLPEFFHKPLQRVKLNHGQIRCTESAARMLVDFALIDLMARSPYVAFLDRFQEGRGKRPGIPSIVMYNRNRNGIVMQYRFDKISQSRMLEECKYWVRYFHKYGCTSVKVIKLTEIYLLQNEVAEIKAYWLNESAYETYFEALDNNVEI